MAKCQFYHEERRVIANPELRRDGQEGMPQSHAVAV